MSKILARPIVAATLAASLGVAATAADEGILVTKFGAVADDDGSDSAAINRAIASASEGETVLLPAGTFVVSEAIKPRSGIVLKGAGQDLTTVKHAGQRKHTLIEIVEGTEKVEVADMTLDGANSPNATNGVTAYRASSVDLHDLTVRNFVDYKAFGPHGIALYHTPDSSITDNTISNIGPTATWGCGIRVADDSTHCRILRNRISNTGRGGIMTNGGATDAIIRENVIFGTHGIAFAIEVHSQSVRTVIEDNIVDHGLSIVSNNCAVRRNVVVDPTGTWGGYGIEGGGGRDGVVTDNHIDMGQKLGISLSRGRRAAASYSLWSHNKFLNCLQWGIQMQGGGPEGSISGLYFYKNVFAGTRKGHAAAAYPGHDGHAIRFHGYVRDVVFDGNQISDNGGLAIQMTGEPGVTDISFIDNVFTGNQGGLMDPFPADAKVEWKGNFVSGNGPRGTEPTTSGLDGEAPSVSFECPEEAVVGEPVAFRSTSSTPGSEVGHVLWDFGAGVPSAEHQPTHVYDRPGRYRVSLVVWNKDGRAGRPAEKMILVRAR